MAYTTSYYKTQSLVENQFAFSWLKQPGLIERVNWDSSAAKKIGPQNRTGVSTNILRPPRATGTISSYGSRNATLPGNTGSDITYQAINDAYLPLTIAYTAEMNLQTSIEELSTTRSKEDIKRYIDQYVIQLRNKIENNIATVALGGIGQATALTTDQTTYSANVIETLGNAKAMMIERNAIVSGQRDLYAIVHPRVAPKLGAGAASNFHFGSNPEGVQTRSIVPLSLGGFDLIESPLVSSQSLVAQWSGVTCTAAVGFDGATAVGGSTPASGWAETTTVALTGLPANQVIPMGTIIYSGVSENWINPDTGSSGAQATYAVTSTVTATSGGVATVTIKDAPIYSGPYKNIDRSTAIPSGTTWFIFGAGGSASVQKPLICLGPDAIVGVSPEILLPSTVKVLSKLDFGGIKLAIIEDHFPGTVQGILKIIGFYGLTVQKGEAAVVIQGA